MISAAAFFFGALACVILALAREPIYGIYFYLASTFVHPPSRWWGYMLPDLRWSLLSAAITTIAIVVHRDKLGVKPAWSANVPAAIFASFAGYMWLESLWAVDWDTHSIGAIQYIKYLLAFWFVYRLMDTKEHVRNLLLAHAMGCGLLGVFAHFAERIGDRLDGVGGPGMDDANTLGMYLATGVLACAGLILTQKGWRRWAAFACVAFILNGLVLANSRGSLLGLVSGGVVFTFLKAKHHRRLFWILVLLAIPAAIKIVDQAFIDRMFSIGNAVTESEEMDDSARSRYELKKAQIQMFLDHPLGCGYRCTASLSPQYLDRQWLTGDEEDAARSSHNTFMSALVEQGVPGAALFLALVGWILLTAWRVSRWSAQQADPDLTTFAASLCGGLAVWLVAGIATDYQMAEVQFWLLAMLVSVIQLKEAAPQVGHADHAAPNILRMRSTG